MTQRFLVWMGALVSFSAFAAPAPPSDLQRAFEVASLRASTAEAAVEKLEGRLKALEALTKQAPAVGEDTTLQLGALRGAIEELRFKLDKYTSDLTDYQLSQEERLLWSEQRIARIEALLGATPPPRPCLGDPTLCRGSTPEEATSSTSSATDTSATVSPGGSPVATARKLIADGKQQAARGVLTARLNERPPDAEAAEVSYLIGLTQFNEGNCREAEVTFRSVSDRYGATEWAPFAQLKIGECLESRGQTGNAQVVYKNVITVYPSSKAAAEARAKLKP